MRVIISGASGFLGSNIVKKAMAANISVVAITSRVAALPGVTIVSTKDFLKNGYPCSSEDVFINCLFPTNADGFKLANGLDKVYRMITMARKSGVGAFVNISSQSVYPSKRTDPAREGDFLSLETPYAVGKYSSEVFLNQVFQDVPHTNIRMASLLGVGYEQRILNRMVDQALKGMQLKVVGGMQRYGFLDVRDAADGIVTMVQTEPGTWKEVYNLGRNESYTLMDVVECIVSEMKSQTGMETTYTVSEGQDYRNSSLDATSFMRDFHWIPATILSESIATIIYSKVKEAGR